MNAKPQEVQSPRVWWEETLPVPIRHATAILPAEVLTRDGVFWTDGSGVVAVPYLNRTFSYRRFGRWAKGGAIAPAHVEVVAQADGYSELIVGVQAPGGWRRLLWPSVRLMKIARAIAEDARHKMVREASSRGTATQLPPKHRVAAARALRAG